MTRQTVAALRVWLADQDGGPDDALFTTSSQASTEGQSLSEHTAPFDAVAQGLEGEAEITIAGTPLKVPAGELVLMPANQPHAVHARTRFKMLLTMIPLA